MYCRAIERFALQNNNNHLEIENKIDKIEMVCISSFAQYRQTADTNQFLSFHLVRTFRRIGCVIFFFLAIPKNQPASFSFPGGNTEEMCTRSVPFCVAWLGNLLYWPYLSPDVVNMWSTIIFI